MTRDKDSILIVDDFIENLKLLSTILKEAGYEVLTTTKGSEAIEIAREHSPKLVLLDVMMPGMDGYEVCEILKSDPLTKSIVVIFISAKSGINDKIKGLGLGAVDFMTKPFHKSEVLARLKTHISLKNVSLKLEESEKKYLTLINNVQDGVFLWNFDDGLHFANPSFCSMLDCDEMEIINSPLEKIFYKSDLSEVESIFTRYLTSSENLATSEHSFKMKNKKGETVLTSCLPVQVVFDGKASLLITARDMTERKSLESQLAQSQRLEALGLLSSGIAHDFNNILALINGYTELTMYELAENPSALEKLQVVLDAGRSAVSLTKGLLSFGRKKNLELEPLDVGEELKRVFSFLRRGLPKSIDFSLDLPSSPLHVMADTGELQQVIINLCLNARDAMPDGGDLIVKLRAQKKIKSPANSSGDSPPGEHVVISVSDNGSGISDEAMDKIFNPFFTSKKTGNGLGLAMVERVINNHQGWVDVSTQIGKGTCFSIFLPRLMPQEIKKVSGKLYKHEFNADLNKILVVDDDQMQISMLQYFLEKEKYQVLTATSTKDALKIMKEHSPEISLIIVDYLMPKLTGAECVEAVRREWPDTKVLMISGAIKVPVKGELLLRKPFTSKDLFQAMDKMA